MLAGSVASQLVGRAIFVLKAFFVTMKKEKNFVARLILLSVLAAIMPIASHLKYARKVSAKKSGRAYNRSL